MKRGEAIILFISDVHIGESSTCSEWAGGIPAMLTSRVSGLVRRWPMVFAW